jgi:hypothetical protein
MGFLPSFSLAPPGVEHLTDGEASNNVGWGKPMGAVQDERALVTGEWLTLN